MIEMASKKFLVAITDAEYPSFQPEQAVLSKLDSDLVKFQCKTEDDVIRCCKDADAILVQYAPITGKVLRALKNVKIIARYGVGVDNIDCAAATENGVIVANVVYDICDVADHTVGLILSLVRKIPWVFQSTKSGEWDWKRFQPIMRIKGKTVGIIGFGRVGKEVAKRLSNFGVNLLVYDPYIPSETFEKFQVKKADLKEILKKSDVITLHVALTEETRHMIGEDELRNLKKTAILINACRGPVVDETALCTALKEGWIAGAGLDVLEREPPMRDNPMVELENVIVTPHMAWYSVDSVIEIQRAAAEEVAKVLCGKLAERIVNKEVLSIPASRKRFTVDRGTK